MRELFIVLALLGAGWIVGLWLGRLIRGSLR